MAKIWQDCWRFGANFIPSTAINQLEMWQADTFDPKTIDRELGYAQKIGMNIMRVYLHDLLWQQDACGFMKRMEEYLAIADAHGIATMFVFFDDCWRTDFALGRQPEPKPFTHNSGWVQSPGSAAADDLAQRPRLEAYVKGVLNHFAHDRRIALWDLYNEPGNGKSGDHVTRSGLRGNASMPLLKDVFRWAKEVEIDQPVTAGIWNRYSTDFDELNQLMLKESEVLTFHCYCNAVETTVTCDFFRMLGDGRPVLCSEYMCRPNCTFKECLPIYKRNGIGAINWGLVAGKTQTIYPWGWDESKGQPEAPFHDIFNPDGSLLIPGDAEAFAEATGVAR